MVRVSTNRGTSTRNVKSGGSKSKRAKPSMRSGRGTVSRSSSGSYGKLPEEKQVLDQEEETSDDSVDIFIKSILPG